MEDPSSGVGAKCSRCEAFFSDRYLMADHLGAHHNINRGLLRLQTEPNATPRVRNQTEEQGRQDGRLGRRAPSNRDIRVVINAERAGIRKRQRAALSPQTSMLGPSQTAPNASGTQDDLATAQSETANVEPAIPVAASDIAVTEGGLVAPAATGDSSNDTLGSLNTSLTHGRLAEFRGAFDGNEELAEWLGSWTSSVEERIPRTVRSVGPSINNRLRSGSAHFSQDELLLALRQLEKDGAVDLIASNDVHYVRLAVRQRRICVVSWQS
ncbi:hypothetical protein LTR12_011392 [Friedmanniomyces endolithicus]|nr:hypothetical protein LTR74_015991 [Friedmanniomyces endolithicus]KAK1814194.1 hypothetical protein LTR12_011392 [Friedmanniomyces endolithicus]